MTSSAAPSRSALPYSILRRVSSPKGAALRRSTPSQSATRVPTPGAACPPADRGREGWQRRRRERRRWDTDRRVWAGVWRRMQRWL